MHLLMTIGAFLLQINKSVYYIFAISCRLLQIPLCDWTVIGLLIKARGSASKFTVGMLKSVKITIFDNF